MILSRIQSFIIAIIHILFLRKNERLKYSFYPQPPTELDYQSKSEYEHEMKLFNYRKNFVEGSHVKSIYTAIAHYWLIKKMLNAKKWYFISDDDFTLENSIFRVFPDKFSNGNAIYFTCQSDKSLTLEEVGTKAFNARNELREWAKSYNCKNKNLLEIAKDKLEYELSHHDFYDYKLIGDIMCPVRASNPIRHPLPDKDEGSRWINIISYIHSLSENELSNLIMQVNSCGNDL